MKNNYRRLFKKSDIIIIGIIMFVMVICFTVVKTSQNGAYANIYLDGALIKSVPLDSDTIFNLRELNSFYPDMKIAVENGGIMILESDCHDKICVHTGRISSKYQTIVCVPNKLVVNIIDDNTNSNIDAVM